MGKDDEQWDTIRNYSITGGNIDQSRAKTILSMREDIARKVHLLIYSFYVVTNASI
jgi:hypothetical protein